MKHVSSSFVSAGLLALAVLTGSIGCSTTNNTSRASAAVKRPTYALAVAVRGGVEPTAAQWNAMYEKFYTALAARGLLLINDYRRADHIINVDFLPDPINPALGTAVISSVVPNTGAYASTASRSSTSPSIYTSTFGRTHNPLWGPSSAYDHYYNYNGYDYSGGNYTYVTPPVSGGGAKPVTPPHRPRPVNPVDCPPGTSPYQPPPSFVTDHPRYHHSHDTSPSTPSSYSARHSAPISDGSLTYSRSSSDRSSYSPPQSSSSYSGPSPSSSSSYSAPSYSAPSYSPPPEPSYSAPSYSAPSEPSSSRDSGVQVHPH